MRSGLAALALLLALAACGDKAPAPPPPARIVKALTVGASAVEQARSFGGDVRARHETLAGFRVGGKLVERLVEVGAVVKAGQPLARLDAADLALRASETEAQLALAGAEAQRLRDLQAKHFVSQAAVDARDTALKTAHAQAALARNQSAYATLYADRDGVVAEVLAQPGQVLAAGQAVFRLAWAGEREVAIAIPEAAIAGIKVGSAAEISLWSTPERVWRGRVRELAPVADAATRSYAARVSFVEDGAQAAPPLGMSATVKLRLPAATALRVPIASIFQQGEQPALWVIDENNKLNLRPVRIAAYGDDGAQVVAGLVPGERIVSAGVNRLHAGETVSIAP